MTHMLAPFFSCLLFFLTVFSLFREMIKVLHAYALGAAVHNGALAPVGRKMDGIDAPVVWIADMICESKDKCKSVTFNNLHLRQ